MAVKGNDDIKYVYAICKREYNWGTRVYDKQQSHQDVFENQYPPNQIITLGSKVCMPNLSLWFSLFKSYAES